MQRQMHFFFGCYKWPKQQDLLYKTEMQFEMQRRNAIRNAIFFFFGIIGIFQKSMIVRTIIK
jgi:hypothetical protein